MTNNVLKPKRNLPWKPILIAGAVLVVVAIALINTIGKTSARDLSIGDCFEIPPSGEFSNVTDQDCDGPHEAEIFASVTGTSSMVEERCIETWFAMREDFAVPDDVGVGFVDIEDGESLCVLTSDSGQLVGSVTP